jgi:hypothetical protein
MVRNQLRKIRQTAARPRRLRSTGSAIRSVARERQRAARSSCAEKTSRRSPGTDELRSHEDAGDRWIDLGTELSNLRLANLRLANLRLANLRLANNRPDRTENLALSRSIQS